MKYSKFDQSLSIARVTAMVLILCFGARGFGVAADASTPITQRMTPAPAKGEYIDRCTTDLAPGQTHAWQVMAAVHMYILSHRDNNGAFAITEATGEIRLLDFVDIRQPVRHLKSNGQYLVCTDFQKRVATANITMSTFGSASRPESWRSKTSRFTRRPCTRTAPGLRFPATLTMIRSSTSPIDLLVICRWTRGRETPNRGCVGAADGTTAMVAPTYNSAGERRSTFSHVINMR